MTKSHIKLFLRFLPALAGLLSLFAFWFSGELCAQDKASSNVAAVNLAAPPIALVSTSATNASNALTDSAGKAQPVELAQPVASAPLADVDPDTLGLFSKAEGGLGASMWDGTSRALVDTLLPDLTLPTRSSALNDLARRLLLSIAAVPAGEAPATPVNRMSLRLEKLLALGDIPHAYQLAMKAQPNRLEDAVLRDVVEASLIAPDSKIYCDKIPERIAQGKHADDWQKAMLLCQLRAGDTNAAQLTLDVMRESKNKDTIFLLLASRALVGQEKKLPRQLTPLRPTTLGIIRQLDAPLPPDVYTHPDAVLIPELIRASAQIDTSRLLLAERAANAGIVSPGQLADAYKSIVFPADNFQNPAETSEQGVRLRALLFQAAEKETAPTKMAELIIKFMDNVEPAFFVGSGGQALADLAAKIPATTDNNLFAPSAAKLFALSGRSDKALAWLKLAQAATNLPSVVEQLARNWPIFALSGIVPDEAYANGMKAWLDNCLGDPSLNPTALRQRRRQAGDVLVLLNAAGFAVSEDAWLKVLEGSTSTSQVAMPSSVLLERLGRAGQANHIGESVLLSILMAGDEPSERPLFVTAEIIRALRHVGLMSDALAVAREAVVGALATSTT